MTSTELTTNQVNDIARMARIAVTDAEVEKLKGELSTILEDVNKLNELDTEGVEPTSQVTGLENRWRADEVNDEYTREQMLASAIETAEDHIKVKQVLKGND